MTHRGPQARRRWSRPPVRARRRRSPPTTTPRAGRSPRTAPARSTGPMLPTPGVNARIGRWRCALTCGTTAPHQIPTPATGPRTRGLQHALLEGLTVDHAPAAGAVIVWPQSDDNDSGHVAYVQSVTVNSVTGADQVTLQEMNDTTFDDPAQGQGDTMTMSMTASDLAQVQIIHAPGSTTGTVPTTPPSRPTPTASPTRTTPAPTSTSPTRTAPPVRTPPAKATKTTKTTKPSRSTRRHRSSRRPRRPRRSRAHRRA